MLRKMVKGGYTRKTGEWSFVYTNEDLKRICGTVDLIQYVKMHQRYYAAHIIRKDNNSIAKRLFFNNDEARTRGRQHTLKSIVLKNEEISENKLCRLALERKI